MGTLIFDFFGVICSEVAPFWLARHFAPDQAVAIKGEVVHAADTGAITQNEMFAELSWRTGVEPAQIEREWHELAQIDPGMVALLRELQPHRTLGLLTNSASQFVRTLIQENDLAQYFSVIVVSSEVRSAKPDARAYETILAGLAVKPADAVLIDDNAANVQGARDVGMGGILFESEALLRPKIGV